MSFADLLGSGVTGKLGMTEIQGLLLSTFTRPLMRVRSANCITLWFPIDLVGRISIIPRLTVDSRFLKMCRKISVADRRQVEIFQPNKYANASLYAYDCNLTSHIKRTQTSDNHVSAGKQMLT